MNYSYRGDCRGRRRQHYLQELRTRIITLDKTKMVFVNGRGRPPRGSSKVGVVSWEGKCVCFVASNGFYWHGTKLGGWQKHPPDVSLENRKRPATSGRGRRPNGNERVGVDVSYNTEHDCYQTENLYFWHGTYNGGWKKYPPGMDPF